MSCQATACGARPAAWATAARRPAASRPAPFGCRLHQGSGYGLRKDQKSSLVCRTSQESGTVVVEPTIPATAADALWAAFAAAVSGEWEGVTASFEADGTPIPLDEYYVPQAYRDWGVELFDWQSQSSMLADESGLSATNRRMMPTVGCEADAIAFTQEASQLYQAAASSNTIAADGSYSHGPADISSADCHKAAFEHCLVLQPMQSRVRVVHNLQRQGADKRWALASIDLHNERYDSPYRGKLELSGCGGGMKAFASDKRLQAEAVQGSWTASGVRYSVDPSSGECSNTVVDGEAWAADSLPALVLHPLNAWSSCSIGGGDGSEGSEGDVSLAAGVLLGEDGSGMAMVTRRLVAGQLVEAQLLRLTRQEA